VVCGDTGVGHLATAYGTPSVLLFGPTPPAEWGPPPSRRQHAVLWHGTGPTDSREDRPNPALLAVSVAEVLDAATAMLDATRPADGVFTTQPRTEHEVRLVGQRFRSGSGSGRTEEEPAMSVVESGVDHPFCSRSSCPCWT